MVIEEYQQNLRFLETIEHLVKYFSLSLTRWNTIGFAVGNEICMEAISLANYERIFIHSLHSLSNNTQEATEGKLLSTKYMIVVFFKRIFFISMKPAFVCNC